MKKVTVRVYGGLGNQLFQYAFGKAYALENSKELIIDDMSGFGNHDEYGRDFILDQFSIKDSFLSSSFSKYIISLQMFWKIGRKLSFVLKEKDIKSFDKSILSTQGCFLDGYWQSPFYFDRYKKELQNSLRIKDISNKNILDMKEKISLKANSVAIGLRFFQEVTKDGLHQVIEQSYYKEAIALIKEKIENPHFFVFSNDVSRAKSYLKFEDNITIINPIKENRGAIYDLYLMTQCKHFIISNSTFHWWGAYLGEKEQSIVVAPENGYYNTNMMKTNWIKI